MRFTCKRHQWADDAMACPLCFEEMPELPGKEQRTIGRLFLAEPRREYRRASVVTEYRPVNMAVPVAPAPMQTMSVPACLMQPDSEAGAQRRRDALRSQDLWLSKKLPTHTTTPLRRERY